MQCIICDNQMNYYFSKTFKKYNLNKVDYYVCSNCGFGASETHYNMSKKTWEKLNLEFHINHNLKVEDPYNRHKRYFQQSIMLKLMKQYNFFDDGLILDWGSGEGNVSELANEFFDISILNFDRYIEPKINKIKEKNLEKKGYSLVLNNAVFEHVTSRDTLNEIEQYVSDTGAFAIHTLVPEKMPQDSQWMYLLPVHCSFHTNKSMGILMNQWDYKCSVYNEQAKMWVLFKKDVEEISKKVKLLNNRLGWNYLKFKKGFMDYWK